MKRNKVLNFIATLALTLLCIFCIITLSSNNRKSFIEEQRVSIGLTTAQSEQLSKQQKGYYYSTLSDEDKLVYVDVLFSISNLLTNVPIGNINEVQLQRIVDCVLADHPEIYYFNNYEYVIYNQDDYNILYFSPVYNYSANEIEHINKSIDNYVRDCFRDISMSDDSYSIVKHIYEYVVLNTDYVLDSKNNQYITSVMLEGESVCNGYAKAFQYLCYEADIPCIFVKGIIREDATMHAWNIVQLQGQYYHVDCTWGDTNYDEYRNSYENISYDYLCVPDSDILKTHIVSNKFTLPVCDSMSCNYYIKEHLYLDTFNYAHYCSLLESAVDILTVRCKDNDVLEEYTTYLFDKENIFNSLNTTDVYYRINDINNTFTVYLN